MKLPHRRDILHLAAGAAALPAVSRIAAAQTYPSRPVRLLVGFAAGGVADIIARLMAQRLSERLGQQFVVENRAGAGSNIATEVLVRSPPDGYTLLQVTVSNAINATLYDKLAFDLTRDIVPIASIMRSPGVLEVNPSFPAKTVPSSSPMPRPIRERSMSPRQGQGAHRTFTPSCSRSWPVSTWSRCTIGARGRRCPISSAARFTPCLTR
jgi:Tripartite tricarboxylate transporter family receptor